MTYRRRLVGCSHGETITTITAGLAREVCESCGNVSLRYVAKAVRLDLPTEPIEVVEGPYKPAPTDSDSPRTVVRCGLCAQPAVYSIPDGVMCDEHAWQAAAYLNWDVVDPWVPIRLDRSSAP